MKKVRGWIEVDDRGIAEKSEFSHSMKDSEVPVRMLMTIVNARLSLARVMLPAEPIGIGAQWETTKDIKMYGFQMKQVDRYTLTDKVGDELKINVDIVQTAPKQTLTFAEEGVEYALESLSMSAQGTVVLNLNALEGSAKAPKRSSSIPPCSWKRASDTRLRRRRPQSSRTPRRRAPRARSSSPAVGLLESRSCECFASPWYCQSRLA